MHFKLIIALVDDEKSDKIMDAARLAGATGASVFSGIFIFSMLGSNTFHDVMLGR